MLRRFSAFLLALSAVIGINAQGNDFGMGYSVEATKKLTYNTDLSVEGEMRTQDNSRQMERWTAGATFGWKFYDRGTFSLKASAGWKYMWMYNLTERNLKYSNDDAVNGIYEGYNKHMAAWRHRHRTSVSLAASYKPNKRWTFQLKETFQYTHYCADSTDNYRYRVNSNNAFYLKDIRTKTWEPKDRMMLRSKLTVSYNIRHVPLEPFASVDYGCGLNYCTSKWKLTAGMDYKLLKKHKFTVFYRYTTEDDSDDPNGHLIGLGYGFKF